MIEKDTTITLLCIQVYRVNNNLQQINVFAIDEVIFCAKKGEGQTMTDVFQQKLMSRCFVSFFSKEG